MTTLAKPVSRETAVIIQARPLMLEVHARHLVFRRKGKRVRYSIDLESCYWLAVKRQVAEDREAQRKARAERKKGGR